MVERFGDTNLGGMRFWLVVPREEEEPGIIEVPADGFLIGRGDTCDLVLDDGKVSKQHARIRLRPGHTPEIEDIGSANGTFVNGARVRPRAGFAGGDATSSIDDGDWIQIGDTTMRASFVHPSKRQR